MINFTPLARTVFNRRYRQIQRWGDCGVDISRRQLRKIICKGAASEFGRQHDFKVLLKLTDDKELAAAFAAAVPLAEYEDIREEVVRMTHGEPSVLWPGICKHFAQSSGTSGGVSKYVPVTADSLRHNHFKGATDAVVQYLHANPRSRMFSGKGLILGGSYSSTLHDAAKGMKIGDLSATLIDRTPAVAGIFKAPKPEIALMSDWEEKLPRLAEAVAYENITNISGVPSWMMTVLKKVMEIRGVRNIHDVWPNLEVFFHGGISFAPYREEYRKITDPSRMHYLENYNASEGFFAVQDDPVSAAMLLLIDAGVWYEFIPFPGGGEPVPMEELQAGKVYELVITAMNGLWRYRIGDTVKIESVGPLRITIAGRTKTFINAFGEEVMEHNAERAIAETCRRHDASVANYTVAPVFASDNHRGHHEWLIEWTWRPKDVKAFAADLDRSLRAINSDYDAKRSHDIFLDPLSITEIAPGIFDRWLATVGNGKLGGQRKIPRLSNDRHIADALRKGKLFGDVGIYF